MGTPRDEHLRRQNIYWDIGRCLEGEARGLASMVFEDIQKALSINDEEMASFYCYFAGVNARRAFTVAAIALDYKEKAREEFNA